MRDWSFKEVFAEVCQMHPKKSKRENIIATLSLWTDGWFDATEGSKREAYIKEALDVVSE